MKKRMIAIMMTMGITAATLTGCGSTKGNGDITGSTFKGNITAETTQDTESDKAESIVSAGIDSKQEVTATTENEVPVTEDTETKKDEKATTQNTDTSAPATDTTEKPSNNSQAKAPKEETQQAAAPAHTHDFQPVYRTVHHDAETHTEDQGHYENVMVQDAKYETRTLFTIIMDCGASFSSYDCSECSAFMIRHKDEFGEAEDENGCAYYTEHLTESNSVSTRDESVKVSDPVYEQQWVSNIVTIIDQEAYDEQVIDHYECSCGARQ